MGNGTVLLYIDEVQYVPQILNDCQAVLDRHRDKATVLLTGSLRPGSRYSRTLEDLLTFGSLPGLCDLSDGLRREVLSAYTSTYLQEEIRAEALARNLGGFSRVLECAAAESGNVLNVSALSKDVGVPASTVRNYFDLLHDTLIVIRVPAYTRNARKRIAWTPKFVFFDTGVRNSCAGLYLDPKTLLKAQAGSLFEQYITLEIHRRLEYLPGCPWRIAYWRAASGAEVQEMDHGIYAVPWQMV